MLGSLVSSPAEHKPVLALRMSARQFRLGAGLLDRTMNSRFINEERPGTDQDEPSRGREGAWGHFGIPFPHAFTLLLIVANEIEESAFRASTNTVLGRLTY